MQGDYSERRELLGMPLSTCASPAATLSSAVVIPMCLGSPPSSMRLTPIAQRMNEACGCRTIRQSLDYNKLWIRLSSVCVKAGHYSVLA